MTWNSNSGQPPLVLTDLQSVRQGPRDASLIVAVRNASRKLSWEELSKFSPNYPVLGLENAHYLPTSSRRPWSRQVPPWRHRWTAQHIIPLWFNFSRYYRQCVKVSGLETKWHQWDITFIFLLKNVSTLIQKVGPLLYKELLKRWTIAYLQLHQIAIEGPT